MENKLDDDVVSNGDEWKNYRIWVIDTVRRLRGEVDDLRKQINDVVMVKLGDLENKITALQVKSGVWGLLAGLLGVVIAWIIKGQMGL